MLNHSANKDEAIVPQAATTAARSVETSPEPDTDAKPLFDNVKPIDVYNEGGSGNETGDQRQRKAILEQAVPGEWNIGGNGGGALYRQSNEDKKAEKEEEFRAFLDRIQDQYEEQKKQEEERRELTRAEIDMLSRQTISTKSGNVTALDIVRATDKMLDNWDNTFDEMVEQGVAQPSDKAKLKKAMLDYNKLMRSDKSAEEKQAERQKMILDGKITPAQMEVIDKKAIVENIANSAKLDTEGVERASAASKISVDERKKYFSDAKSNNSETVVYTSSVDSGIKSPLKLTETYNANASLLAVAPNTADVKPMAVTASVKSEMAFG